MQVSIALSDFNAVLRMTTLAAGFGLIVSAALASASLLPRTLVSQIVLIALALAIGFEALSALNGHLVFEPKLIAFRLICYALLFSGVLIGLVTTVAGGRTLSDWSSTLMVTLIAVAAPFTWNSLQGFVSTSTARASFMDSSPVALGFSSGSVAIAALAIALRSSKVFDYIIGTIGFGAWLVICLQSGSRGALLSLFLSSALLSGLSFANAPKRIAPLLLIVLALGAGRVALADNVTEQVIYVIKRFESILSFETDASIAGGAHSRAYLLEHNLSLPGLLLLGGEGFDPDAYPHNFEVEALVRLGAPIALIFITVVIFLLWTMIRVLRAQGVGVGVAVVFAMGLFTFFNSQTNMMWEFLRPLWLCLGLAFGMVVAQKTTV